MWTEKEIGNHMPTPDELAYYQAQLIEDITDFLAHTTDPKARQEFTQALVRAKQDPQFAYDFLVRAHQYFTQATQGAKKELLGISLPAHPTVYQQHIFDSLAYALRVHPEKEQECKQLLQAAIDNPEWAELLVKARQSENKDAFSSIIQQAHEQREQEKASAWKIRRETLLGIPLPQNPTVYQQQLFELVELAITHHPEKEQAYKRGVKRAIDDPLWAEKIAKQNYPQGQGKETDEGQTPEPTNLGQTATASDPSGEQDQSEQLEEEEEIDIVDGQPTNVWLYLALAILGTAILLIAFVDASQDAVIGIGAIVALIVIGVFVGARERVQIHDEPEEDFEEEETEEETLQEDEVVLGIDIKTRKMVRVSGVDRQSGMYVLGVPGVGKSSMLETIIYQDICKGYPVIVLDPHGDLIEHVIAQMPAERLKDTYLLDMEDEAFPFGVNVFTGKKNQTGVEQARSVDRVMHVFEALWGDVLSQQGLPRYLRASVLTLMQNPGMSLVDMKPLLLNAPFRKRLLENVDDVSILEFWDYSYDKLADSVRRRAIDSLVNRLEALFTGRSLIRNILGQTKTTIDFRRSIENSEIILIRLPIQTLPQDAALIGTMLIAQIHAAVFSFGDMALHRRPSFSLFIDEFQNFLTKDIEEIFSQGRKFGSRLCVAHQGRDQLPKFLGEACGRARTKITFQATADDAREVAHYYLREATEVRKEDINPHPINYLLTYGHTNPQVKEFINRYLRPVHLAPKTKKQVEVTTFRPSLLFNPYETKTGKPNVDDPLPYLNALLYQEVEVKRDRGAIILPKIVYGFSDCGFGYFHVLRKNRKLLPHLAIAAEWELEEFRKQLWGRREEVDELITFLTLLRATMIELAKNPLGEKKAQTANEVAQSIINLPRRTAFMRVGTNIATARTLDTPVAVPSGEFIRRKKLIREQTRKKYCQERSTVERELKNRQEEPGEQETSGPKTAQRLVIVCPHCQSTQNNTRFCSVCGESLQAAPKETDGQPRTVSGEKDKGERKPQARKRFREMDDEELD